MTTENIDKNSTLISTDNKSKAIINLGNQLSLVSPNLHTFDMFLIGVLNRTVNLNNGFTTLIRQNNFIAAAPLIRLNLDSFMKLYAARISEYDLDTFTLKVMAGEHIRNMKLKGSKQRLTDKYLIDELSKIEGMNWVKSVYESGNSYIHFADSGIFSAQTIIDKENKTIGLSIGFHDNFIKEENKIASIFWMDKIIDEIVLQAQIWIVEKANKTGFDINKLNDI
jgi:hypothetical protein